MCKVGYSCPLFLVYFFYWDTQHDIEGLWIYSGWMTLLFWQVFQGRLICPETQLKWQGALRHSSCCWGRKIWNLTWWRRNNQNLGAGSKNESRN